MRGGEGRGGGGEGEGRGGGGEGRGGEAEGRRKRWEGREGEGLHPANICIYINYCLHICC